MSLCPALHHGAKACLGIFGSVATPVMGCLAEHDHSRSVCGCCTLCQAAILCGPESDMTRDRRIRRGFMTWIPRHTAATVISCKGSSAAVFCARAGRATQKNIKSAQSQVLFLSTTPFARPWPEPKRGQRSSHQCLEDLVRVVGLEPTLLSETEFESVASTIPPHPQPKAFHGSGRITRSGMRPLFTRQVRGSSSPKAAFRAPPWEISRMDQPDLTGCGPQTCRKCPYRRFHSRE